MQVFILYRFTPDAVFFMGVYTTLALAQAGRTDKIQAYVDAQNAERDLLYGAGESCDAVLTPGDVLPFVLIKEKTVK